MGAGVEPQKNFEAPLLEVMMMKLFLEIVPATSMQLSR